MTTNKIFKRNIPIGLTAMLLSSIQVFAATATLEEIVVTAQKRSENLQDVPLAITAITGESIERENIFDLEGVATKVPGLTFSPFSPGQSIIALRGVSSNDDGAGTDNSVAVFVDGVYSGRVSNVNTELFDLEGVEVLRGPQGTLYGKNTIGGAIVIRSIKPNTEELDAKLRLNIGNFGRRDVAGLITGPLSENLAGKFSFSQRKRDGWVDNVVLNKEQKDEDSAAYRMQLLYTAGKAEALFSADYNKLEVEDMARIPITQGNVGGFPTIRSEYEALCGNRGPGCSTNPTDGFAEKESSGASVQVTYDFDSFEFTSITSYRKNEGNWAMDSLGSPGFIPGVSLSPAASSPAVSDIIDDESDQFTQELRIAGETGSGKYVVGLWYSKEETDRMETFDLFIPGLFPLGDDSARYTQVNETKSYAIFGQYDWDITERLSLDLGARYSLDDKEIDTVAFGNAVFPVIGTDFVASASENWSAFTPKVVLSFQVSDEINSYISIAKGFKSGGFAAAPTTLEDTEPLDPEEALNYEFGLKADFFDNSLRVNSAIFYAEYKDLQFQQFGPRPGVAELGIFRTVNLEEAKAKGLELEATWLPTDNLTISGAYGYQDTEIVDGAIPNSVFSDQSGQDLFRAPQTKSSLEANYVFPLDITGELSLNVNYRYTDDQRGEAEPYAIQPAFEFFNARLAWLSEDERFEISLWGDNLKDEEYISHIYTLSSEVIAVFGEPRMYGVSFTWNMP